jgi:toxin ParE1/3/4
MVHVFLARQARLDLVEIGAYIAQGNPRAADHWLTLIDRKCRTLAFTPTIGRKRDELASGLRSFPIGDYVIFYRPAQGGIQVIRVLHGARDIDEFF